MAVEWYKKRSEVRDKEVERHWTHTDAIAAKSEVVSERMVNAWERFGRIYSREYHDMNVLMNGKDFNRPEVMREMHRLFSMEGEDHRFGKRGQDARVDLSSMHRRVKHMLYCKKMEKVCEAMWFVTVLTRMRDHCRRTNHPLPISCFKFLGAVYMIIQYGFEVTEGVFYNILEQTVEEQDHKEIIVHRALRAIREHLSIDAETFLDYLNSRSIQPCSELLAQVRQIRVARTRAERAAHIKFAMDHDKMASFSPRPPPGSVPRDVKSTRPHRHSDMNLLPVNRGLALIKETSELNDYGETFNALKTPLGYSKHRPPPRSMTANDVYPPTPAGFRHHHVDAFPPGGVLWEDSDNKDYDDDSGDDGLSEDSDYEEEGDRIQLQIPSHIKNKQRLSND